MSSQAKLSAYGALATIATSLSLLSVFATSGWVVPVMGGILIVAGSCALIRVSPLPSAFEPITAALAVLIWLTILDARASAHLGFIPGRASFRRLGHVARTGFTEIHQLPTPAPAQTGLVMLTVVGVAAIALVVDLVTVTLRRAALAGLPLLALFTVCAATGHGGVGVVSFIAAASGYLWLLYADNRDKVTRWGAAVGSGSRARPASAWSTDAASAPAPASLGRQVGAVAISLGVIVPLFIPGLHTGINKHGGNGTGDGDGGGSVQTFDPIVKVGSDLRNVNASPVLSFTSTAADPGYLRLTSLDEFDGNSFTEAQLTAPATATVSEALPVTAPQGQTVTTTVTMSDAADYRWLPAPATVLGVSVGSAWRYDPGTATVFSATANTESLQYTARSVANQPTSAELAAAARPDSSLTADMQVPTDLSPGIRALAKHITAKATTRYDAAVDIQRYLTSSRFTYDTTIDANTGPHPLADFLLGTRHGFCQQFATSMAVLARLSGIPSRVAVGFTRGKEHGTTWTVSTHDAHAWPELWFQGYGWLPFEPTPRADGQAVTPSYAQHVKGSGKGGRDDFAPKPGSSPNVPKDLRPKPAAGTNGGATVASRHHHRSTRENLTRLAVWLALLLLGVGLVVPGVARLVVRQLRWRRLRDPAHASVAAWAEVRDTAIDRGLPWDDGRSPRQAATALLVALDATPKTSDSLLRLARFEEESRYAPALSVDVPNARGDIAVIRSAADGMRTGAQRMRARILPRSTILAARGVARRMLRRADSARARLRFAR